MPFFSIIIPSYNRGRVIEKALNSIISQSFTDYEIIIVDDGSTDNTKYTISKYLKDTRIRYYYQDNKGVCSARNTGARAATGKYLLFLDSDDQLTNDALNFYYTSAVEKKPDLLYGDMIFIIPKTKQTKTKSGRNPYGNNDGSGVYIPGAFSIRRDYFFEVGGYDEQISYGENTELKFRILKANPSISFVDKEVLIYEASIDGGSKNLQNMIDANNYIIKKHSEYFKENKNTKQQYLQNVAVAYVKLNQLRKANKYFWKAYCVKIQNIKTLLRFSISLFPFLAKKVWKR